MAEPALAVELAQAAPIPLAARIECGPGELLALAGPSGSGKTTCLRAIAGLIRPASGVVRCNGTTWFDSRTFLLPQQRRVGLVLHSYALFPHLTTFGNVAAALPPTLPAEARRSIVRELLEFVHLGGLEDRLPRELSDGQQHRVALARALARDPQVLLLDEPFSAVDPVTRRRLQHELAEIHRRLKIPIVLATRDLEEAAALADRIVVLHRGATLQSGAPLEVLGHPRTAQIARLVDFHNLYTARVVAHDSACTRISWLDYELQAPLNEAFAPGIEVCWGILPAHCILLWPDRPSCGAHENAVSGTVGEFLPLGENVAVTLSIDGRRDVELRLSIPTQVATRNGLQAGVAASVSLLRIGIHLMPYEPLERTAEVCDGPPVYCIDPSIRGA